MTAAAVQCRHVNVVTPDGREVVRDLSFRIPMGSFTGILGPNGAGKSTLLALILGILQPTSGEIEVLGKAPLHARKGGTLGWVPQRATALENAFPATVGEVVSLGRMTRSPWALTSTQSDRDAVNEALRVVGIEHVRNRRIASLSGGELQRTLIARALASQPQMLLLDEPDTGVDAPSQDQFGELLSQLHTSGMTILVVSHDLHRITERCTDVLCLNQKLYCHCPSHACRHGGELAHCVDEAFAEHQHAYHEQI